MIGDWDRDKLDFAIIVAEAAFRYAEKGNNLEATLAHIRKIGRPGEAKIAERRKIEAAIAQYHVDRGCCDGTFKTPCTFKAQQEERKKTNKRELERQDAQAFQKAQLHGKE